MSIAASFLISAGATATVAFPPPVPAHGAAVQMAVANVRIVALQRIDFAAAHALDRSDRQIRRRGNRIVIDFT